jgi:hypothetical protein
VFSPWSRGNGHERFVTVVVEGKGVLKLDVASCRNGRWSLEVPLS